MSRRSACTWSAAVTSGAIGVLDPTVGTELDGSPIRRLRIPPPLPSRREPAPPRRRPLEVLLEPGLGTASARVRIRS
jgi:hypothetical protein